MSYDLRYTIPAALFARAVTFPRGGRQRSVRILRNFGAAVFSVLALFCLNIALFKGDALPSLAVGFYLGAMLMAVIWMRQHRAAVGHLVNANLTEGDVGLRAGPEGIDSGRRGVYSHIDWSAVRAVQRIQDAVLIHLATTRLIVPDAALDDPARFVADLEGWRAAGVDDLRQT